MLNIQKWNSGRRIIHLHKAQLLYYLLIKISYKYENTVSYYFNFWNYGYFSNNYNPSVCFLLLVCVKIKDCVLSQF